MGLCRAEYACSLLTASHAFKITTVHSSDSFMIVRLTSIAEGHGKARLLLSTLLDGQVLSSSNVIASHHTHFSKSGCQVVPALYRLSQKKIPRSQIVCGSPGETHLRTPDADLTKVSSQPSKKEEFSIRWLNSNGGIDPKAGFRMAECNYPNLSARVSKSSICANNSAIRFNPVHSRSLYSFRSRDSVNRSCASKLSDRSPESLKEAEASNFSGKFPNISFLHIVAFCPADDLSNRRTDFFMLSASAPISFAFDPSLEATLCHKALAGTQTQG